MSTRRFTVVRDGRVLTVDLAQLRQAVANTVARLHREQAGEAEDLVRRPAPIVGSSCVGLARRPYPVHRYVGDEPRR